MSNVERREGGLFASKSLARHLVRGAIAAVLLAWALLHQSSDPAFAVAAAVVAMVAMRGCPACWTVGLFETIGQRTSLSTPYVPSRRVLGCVRCLDPQDLAGGALESQRR
jgi:hypothetical protein